MDLLVHFIVYFLYNLWLDLVEVLKVRYLSVKTKKRVNTVGLFG